jgi:TolB-like protein/DNA-binding winged helix-turn-helix (wHTH) protein
VKTQQTFETGGFRVDAVQRVLLAAGGARVSLSSRAFDLLLFFVRHPGELHTKEALMSAVWPDTVVEENNLTQAIGALRKALGEAPGDHRFFVTVPGRGYKFVAPVRPVEGEGAGESATGSVAPNVRRPRWAVVAALAAVAIGAALVLWPRRPPITDRSIAVMPFENRSEARENEYLALGIQDELLTLLTRVPDLRVTSRNATLRYAGRRGSGPQIGRELGVAYLLEGSVQRAGDIVRVHVTLVDAAADRHVWAESYERSAKDVFAVESEIAQSVASALRIRLTGDERRGLSRPPTENPDAYEAYLRARASAERTTRTESEIRAAIAAYSEAVRLDPSFTIAWAQLSRRHANFFSLAYDRSDERVRLARAALDEATRLAPDSLDVRAATGYFHFVVEGDLAAAESAYRAIEERAPGTIEPAAGLAQITRELGQMDRMKDYSRRVVAIEPLNPYRHSIVCHDYLTSREFELAVRTCQRALELLPGDTGIFAILATIYQAGGALDEARALLADLAPGPGDWRSLRVMSRQHLLDRKPREAIALLSGYLEDGPALGTRRGVVRRWLADAQRQAGDTAAAQASYTRAQAEIESELALQPRNPVLMAELAHVRGRLGLLEAAVRLVPRCRELAGHPRRETYIAECEVARVAAELTSGDPARAVDALKAALAVRGALPPLTPELLRLDPDYDALRGRADFQSLL